MMHDIWFLQYRSHNVFLNGKNVKFKKENKTKVYL